MTKSTEKKPPHDELKTPMKTDSSYKSSKTLLTQTISLKESNFQRNFNKTMTSAKILTFEMDYPKDSLFKITSANVDDDSQKFDKQSYLIDKMNKNDCLTSSGPCIFEKLSSRIFEKECQKTDKIVFSDEEKISMLLPNMKISQKLTSGNYFGDTLIRAGHARYFISINFIE